MICICIWRSLALGFLLPVIRIPILLHISSIRRRFGTGLGFLDFAIPSRRRLGAGLRLLDFAIPIRRRFGAGLRLLDFALRRRLLIGCPRLFDLRLGP